MATLVEGAQPEGNHSEESGSGHHQPISYQCLCEGTTMATLVEVAQHDGNHSESGSGLQQHYDIATDSEEDIYADGFNWDSVSGPDAAAGGNGGDIGCSQRTLALQALQAKHPSVYQQSVLRKGESMATRMGLREGTTMATLVNVAQQEGSRSESGSGHHLSSSNQCLREGTAMATLSKHELKRLRQKASKAADREVELEDLVILAAEASKAADRVMFGEAEMFNRLAGYHECSVYEVAARYRLTCMLGRVLGAWYRHTEHFDSPMPSKVVRRRKKGKKR